MIKPSLVVDTDLKDQAKARLHENAPKKPKSESAQEQEEVEQDEGSDTDSEEDDDDDDDDDDEDDSSDCSSSPSIPDENIDFDLVYTLHSFEATVEGQTSVAKGDSLKLIDDSNSYWWLIKATKTNEIGYIPAENIETPYERLARLNKHRNIEMTSAENAKNCSEPEKLKLKKGSRVTISSELRVQKQYILTDEDEESPKKEDPSEEKEFEYEESEEKMPDDDTTQRPIHESPTAGEPEVAKEMKQSMVTQKEPKTSQDQMNANLTNGTSKTPSWRPTLRIPFTKRPKPPTGSDKDKDKESIGSVGSTSSEPKGAEGEMVTVFAGNISIGEAMYKVIWVKENMKTEDLVELAKERFHIQNHPKQSGVEHYLTMHKAPYHDHEKALEPQMEILPMIRSLTDHLTTPMPDLTNLFLPKIKSSASAEFRDAPQRVTPPSGYVSECSVRFYLHKRIKRTGEKSHQIRLKISFTPPLDEPTKSTFRIPGRKKQTNDNRFDKLIAVDTSVTEKVEDLLSLALEKFHPPSDNENEYGLFWATRPAGRRASSVQEKALRLDKPLVELLKENQSDGSGESYTHFLLKCTQSKRTRPTSTSKTPSTTKHKVSPSMGSDISKQSLVTPVTSIDKHTESQLTRLDALLASQAPSTASKESTGPPSMTVARNADQGVDIVVPNGMLQTKALPNHLVQYTLFSSSRQLILQLTLPAHQNPEALSQVGDLISLSQYGMKLLDEQDTMKRREDDMATNTHAQHTPPSSLIDGAEK